MEFRTARILAGSLAGGPVILWVVAWAVTGGGSRPVGGEPGLSPALGFWIWAAVALGGYAVALVLRQRATDGVERRHRAGPVAGVEPGANPVHTYLLVAWALLEGPAVLSGVLFLLTGSIQLLLAAMPIHAIGVLVTFPRREWYEEPAGVARAGTPQPGDGEPWNG